MGQKAEAQVVLKDFPGLVTKADPLDLPPGAAKDQRNAISTVPGELNVRPGVRQLQFEA